MLTERNRYQDPNIDMPLHLDHVLFTIANHFVRNHSEVTPSSQKKVSQLAEQVLGRRLRDRGTEDKSLRKKEEKEEEELLDIDPNRPLSAIDLVSVVGILFRSKATSIKAQAFMESMKKGDESSALLLLRALEEVPEEEYNKAEFMKMSPLYIAMMKACSSRLFPKDLVFMNGVEGMKQRHAVIKVFLEDLFKKQQEHLPAHYRELQNLPVNELGFLFPFYANDIVTAVKLDGQRFPQLKPKPGTTREEVFEGNLKLLKIPKDRAPEHDLEIDWISARAIYEPVTQVGVVKEDVLTIKAKSPSYALLFCYYFGTKNIPEQYSAIKDTEEYKRACQQLEGMYEASKNDPYKTERLRGWTTENGAEGFMDVNAGIHWDFLGFEEFCFQEANKIPKESDKFSKTMRDGVDMLRGGPLHFNALMRAMMRVVTKKVQGEEVSEFVRVDGVEEMKNNLQQHLTAMHPDLDRQFFSGDWFDMSDDKHHELNEGTDTFYDDIIIRLLMDSKQTGMLQ